MQTTGDQLHGSKGPEHFPSHRAAEYLAQAGGPENTDALVLVDLLLMDAVEAGASDVHVEPWQEGIVVRLRLSGILHRFITMPIELIERIAGRFKVMTDMGRFDTLRPQEGGATPTGPGQTVQFRISIFPTKRGEKIVVRILDTRDRTFRLADLGFDPDVVERLGELLKSSTGVILFTGPTGSGKTTSIYSALNFMLETHGETISIATVEDPVEYNLGQISQAELVPERDFTYPVALRSLMRQDPQVIMIGEIRDPETASIAVQAGLTGHLVLSTTHSAGTAGVFARLLHMNLEPFVVASSVLAVVGMRLLRTTCSVCRVPYEPDPRLFRYLTKEELAQAEFRTGDGCPACNFTGNVSRVAVAEIMIVTEELQEAILNRQPTRALQEIAMRSGMETLWQRGVRRVLRGDVMLEELVRVIPPRTVSNAGGTDEL